MDVFLILPGLVAHSSEDALLSPLGLNRSFLKLMTLCQALSEVRNNDDDNDYACADHSN